MRKFLALSTFASLFLGLAALPLVAAELAGVRADDSVRVGDTTLVLNGQGLRKKAIFKVYVGSLYLSSKQSDAGKILASDSPRRMVMTFVRGVDADALSGPWAECLEANTPGASADVKKSFADLASWMEDVEDQDTMIFTYNPDTGTEVKVKGKVKGTVAGKGFADALFGCWVGPEPPSGDFKEGLLGG